MLSGTLSRNVAWIRLAERRDGGRPVLEASHEHQMRRPKAKRDEPLYQ